jgi:hypothetical protein
MNPNNDAYWESRGYDERPDNWEDEDDDGDGGNDDNRANQLNPNSDAYSRHGGRNSPVVWKCSRVGEPAGPDVRSRKTSSASAAPAELSPSCVNSTTKDFYDEWSN